MAPCITRDRVTQRLLATADSWEQAEFSGGRTAGPEACTDQERTTIERIETLYRSLQVEYDNDRSGIMRDDLSALTREYLIQDFAGPQFLTIHSSRRRSDDAPQPNYFQPMSADAFAAFLREDGERLADAYMEFKRRGVTACAILAPDAVACVNRRAGAYCAESFELLAHHRTSTVRIEDQYYLMDFTFDQFLDYERIRNWQERSAEPVTYAGLLLFPIDRPRLWFDAQGTLR